MKFDQPDDIWDGITSCPALHAEYVEDCQGCEMEMTARGARIDQMHADASSLLKDIAQSGGPQMPETVILSARMEVLLDTLLSDPKNRIKFEGEVGRRVMLQVKQMHRQVKTPTLHVPSHLKR